MEWLDPTKVSMKKPQRKLKKLLIKNLMSFKNKNK